MVINADIWTDYPLQQLLVKQPGLAHLVCVNNIQFNKQGDFSLQVDQIKPPGERTVTYSGIGVFDADLFAQCQPGFFPLRSVLLPAIDKGLVSGEHYRGLWYNINTLSSLGKLRRKLRP